MGACSMGETRTAYKIPVDNPEGKTSLKWILRKYGVNDVERVHLAKDTVLKLRVP
jgi:hypothetical protein